MIEWVRLNKYLEMSGENRRMWYELRESGELLENMHYRHDNRKRVWVNLKAMTAWVEGKRPQRRRSAA